LRLIDVLWVTMSVACLVLGGIHAHVWLRRREAIVTRANLAFAVLALSVVLMGVLELQLFRAADVEEFKRLLFWHHFPVWSAFAAVVAFTHFYLDAGRLWLGLTGIGLRTVALIVGVLTGGAMNYQRIEALGTFDLLGDPVVMVVEASPSPVLLLAQSALLLLALFLADATRQLWRRGDRVRALTISGGLLLYVGVNLMLAIASNWGFLRLPMMGIVFFLPMVFVMGAYLGIDLLRSAELKQDLHESERRLSLAADAADAGLWSLDAVTGRFWATPRAYAILDLPIRPDASVDDLLAVIHPHDRRRVERVLQAARKEDGVSNLDYRIRDRSGGIRWVSSRGSSCMGRKAGSRVISGVIMDISARKQAEDERALQRVELEHLARVNTLAHEINQPLATIMSNTEAAQRLLASPHPDLDELRAIMGDILAADERADAVVKRLRAMLRRGPAMREPLEMDALVAGVLGFMAGELRRRGVAPRTELGAPGARLWGDRVSLEQVLINLINNACDALAVRDAGMRRLVLRTRQEGAELCVEVCDNGAGLKAGAEEIFAPFFTTKTEGLGMGLAISRSIVQAHEGRISVRDDPAGGTVFELRFPAHQPAQGHAEAG
jgi:two-component system sensor kinase FixL